MTQDDLDKSRLQIWRQDGSRVLTAEDARLWLDEIGFCSLLPTGKPLASLAQATAGSAEKTPSNEAVEAARQLTARLIEDHAAAALLWEENSTLSGEQFDAVVSAEVLPYLYALRGDREVKRAPQGSPLMQRVWEALQDGPKTVGELVRDVGHELTEPAILRALHELWVKLRVVPLLETSPSQAGAQWDLTQRYWPDAVKQGASMSQALALSALVSLYLHGAVAATVEEIEDVLGPLASRSRVREVVQGLGASRQLKMLGVGRSSAYALAGGAAETLHDEAEKRDYEALKALRVEASTAAAKKKADMPVRRPRSDDRPHRPREAGARPRPTGEKREWKPRPAAAGAEGEKREFKPREKSAWNPRASGTGAAPRKPWVKREGASTGRGEFPPRKTVGDRKEWKPRAAAGEKREWKPRAAADGVKPWPKRESGAGGAKPWKPRPAGEKPAWKSRESAGGSAERRPWQNRPRGASAAPRPAAERKEWKPRADAGDQREWKPRAGAGTRGADRGDFPPRKSAVPRKEWKPRAGGAGAGKPWQKRDGAGATSRPGGAGRSFARAPFKKTPFSKAPFRRTEGGEAGANSAPKPPFKKTFGAKSGKPFAAGKSFSKPGGKSFGGGKTFSRKPGGKFAGKPGAKFGAKPGGKFGAKPAWKKKTDGDKGAAPGKVKKDE